ncbi:MAG: O-acetylhomoserine aminocarboxypropyltransferase [Fibrobacteres bacterium CG2_30_45_31]|nr:MAG: O-acetylhomoserine aminocarboxypropyltransferase [Fibrobacteres bacterium CG2_30_45_31]
MTITQKFETRSIHAGLKIDAERSRALPIHRTAAYVFNSAKQASDLFGLRELGNIYTRLTNPTVTALEDRLVSLEGGAAGVAVASGTAAIHYTVLNIARTGDEIVSSKTLYGGTFAMFDAILPDQGITTRFVDIHNSLEVEAAITPKTRLIFLETIGNPALDVPNFKTLSEIAHKHHLPLVVDNTFATPYNFRPLEHGADIVIESLTKWISGHGTVLGGIAIEKGGFDWSDPKFTLYNEPDKGYHGLRFAKDLGALTPVAFSIRLRTIPLRNLGAALSPDNAWQILQGVETLPVRMDRHNQNALKVALYLQKHPRVSWVRYPGLEGDPSYANAQVQFENGFGGVVVFGIKEDAKVQGAEAGVHFIEKLKLFSHLANVGDAKSLAIHPASTTHSQLEPKDLLSAGITPDLVRLSIGIEHIDDIIADLEQAFA